MEILEVVVEVEMVVELVSVPPGDMDKLGEGGGAKNAVVETANAMRRQCLRTTVRCTAGMLDRKTDASKLVGSKSVNW